MDYYNPRNELHKTLTLNDYRLTGERIWYAHSQEMRNHLSGNRTRLQWSNVRIDTRLDPALFDPERLGTHHP